LTDKPSRFLLASLHVDSLVSKKTTTKLKSALENLSHGSKALGDAYNKAIDRIDGQEHDDCTLAKQVLSWISYARRPLTTKELCHALAVETRDEDFDSENITDVEEILSVCAGLVTVDEESQIIRLVHYTTQEYLESIRENWHPNAQLEIASTCITYLCFEPFRSGPCLEKDEFESRREKYRFLGYSAEYWPQHIAAVQEEVCELAMALLQDNNLLASARLHEHRWYNSYIPKQVTGLHLTASFGVLHLSTELLFWAKKEKIDLANARDSEGATPLLYAVENGQKTAVQLLLDTGTIDVNVQGGYGRTALMKAVERGYKEIVELLIDTGEVDVNLHSEFGKTALIEAVERGYKEIVELLIDTGEVDVNLHNEFGKTALIEAVERGYKEIVELLIGTGEVDVDEQIRGWTPVYLAVREGHGEIVELLLGPGKADVDKTPDRMELLMYAVYRDYKDVVEFLLGISTDVSKMTDKWPLLALIAANRNMGIGELIGSEEIDFDAKKGFGGDTLLFSAVNYGHGDIVKMLLDAGANVHAKNGSGSTALIGAATRNYKEIVELLLGAGADVHAKNGSGSTALIAAATQGRKETVELLLGAGADVHAKNGIGSTALIAAAGRQGCKETAELLLNRGADVHAKRKDGSTALMAAAHYNQKDTLELLLDRGAEVNVKDENGSTMLIVGAMYWMSRQTVVLLLDRGIDVNAKNRYGRTALIAAARCDHRVMVKLLLGAGSDVHAKDKDGSTALMVAEKKGHKATADLLRTHMSRL
jgi:ankyrin repeat protein